MSRGIRFLSAIAIIIIGFIVFAPVIYNGTAVYPPISPGGQYAGSAEFSATQYISIGPLIARFEGTLTLSSHGNDYRAVVLFVLWSVLDTVT